ncbi:MAG: VCBS repeat-containing protein [Cyclobacteriaceae bacterium]
MPTVLTRCLLLYCLGWLVSCQQDFPQQVEQGQIFSLVSVERSGVDFANELQENEQQNILRYPYYYNGGGVAIGDLNQDGWPDIYFTGNQKGDRLYFNQEEFRFEDVTNKAGILKSNLWTTGVTFADVNNDGWLDIYVCRSGTGTYRNNLLYINQQNGRFSEEGKRYGLNDNGYSVQSNFFDYDRDGDLDMYLVNHSNRFFASQDSLFAMKSQPALEEADKLYRNEGNENFTDVSQGSGINHFGFGLSAAIADLNGDNYPDIYVANDFFEPDFLYLNNGDGTFSDELAANIGHTSFSSMGTDVADFNNDGLPDIMVCDMQASDNYRKKANMASMDVDRFARLVSEGYHYQYMQNTLQMNAGSGHFSEIAELAGVAETDWSWGPLFLDVDNDGWKDLFVSNGIRRDIQYKDILLDLQKKGVDPRQASVMNVIENFPVQKLKNYSFRNNRDLTFSDQTETWGIDMAGFSTGAAYGDLDRDGDLDLVLNNIDDRASIYENSSAANSDYLQIMLKGTEDNVFGIGAKVKITTGELKQYQHLQPSRGFQSSVEPLLHFGLGDTETVDKIEVYWPDGSYSLLEDISANQRIEINQEGAQELPKADPAAPVLFTEVSQEVGIDFKHTENQFDDFAREILLPHRYSQLGPGLVVGDVNGDGLDDFYVGGAKDQAGQLYVQENSGAFTPASSATWQQDLAYEDIGGVFFDSDGDGDQDLYVVSGGNEAKKGSALYQDRLFINDGTGQFTLKADALPELTISSSAARAGDFDRDGDLDLFVGGRVQPSHYPLPVSSALLLNDGGTFTDITSEVAPQLLEIGMVTDAQWTDYDRDQDLDLMLVGEWMPITLLENQDGKLTNASVPAFEKTQGWWYSLTQADMDNDGDIDFLAGNLGLNYKYQATESEPFQVYAHDFDGNQTLDIVLGYFNDGELYPVRGKQCSSQQMPFLKEKFPTYAAFASSTLTEIYDEQTLSEAQHYQAYTFASTYIVNLGEGDFALYPLPQVAQLSSVNAFVIEDVDQDGHLDIVLAGNMYGSEVETARNDAGMGLVLTGNGEGEFTPLTLAKSGLLAPGDVKSMVKIKSSDGSTLLLIGNNDDYLQAFELKN